MDIAEFEAQGKLDVQSYTGPQMRMTLGKAESARSLKEKITGMGHATCFNQIMGGTARISPELNQLERGMEFGSQGRQDDGKDLIIDNIVEILFRNYSYNARKMA